jgi:exopolysaccharide production protein ExoQ
LSTARGFLIATIDEDVSTGNIVAEEPASIWSRASTWGLLLLLIYFAVDGVSPFINEPTAMRAVATSSGGGVLMDRLSKLFICAACLLFALQRHRSVSQLGMQMKLVTCFPILALLLFPVSQQPTRTVSSAILLMGSILLLYYIMSRFSLEQVLEIFLILGTTTIVASIVFAVALPQYGLDQKSGLQTAWKGIFSAKNYLGNIALFFLTGALSYRARNAVLHFIRVSQICLCLAAIAFSRAATAYTLTAVYLVYLLLMKTLHRFRKRDYMVAGTVLLAAVATVAAAIVIWPDLLVSLLGKDLTLTGRTQIWSAVLDSIAKRPLLGYGYQAFWLGLEGESYRIILAVSWILAQAQNGFLDVLLETGVVGLAVVLLVFGFAFRDAVVCLLRSRNDRQLRAVEWYLGIVILTLIYNLDESFLFDPKHLCSMLFLLACVGLKMEWLSLRVAPAQQPVEKAYIESPM